MDHRALTLVVLTACGGGDHANPDGPATPDAEAGGVTGVAHLLHGARVGSTFTATAPLAPASSDGDWYVTADQATVTIERITFTAAAGGNDSGAMLTDCSLTFSKSTDSLASLLDCPFAIDPGTYSGMTVHVGGTFEVMIADAANGIYTDPGSATLLAPTAPAGGAAFVSYTRPLGGTGIEQQFATPLVVNAGDTISIAVVLDAIQTLPITIAGGGSTLTFKDMNQIPVNLFAALSAPGRARYFTSANTAESYNDSLVLANIVRVYEAAGGGQPVYLMFQQTAGPVGSLCATPAPAYPVDPATVTPLASGARLGGWLGRDSGQLTCWAVPVDSTYAAYKALFTLSDSANVGDAATVSCQATSSPTPPSAGATYASGCPAITPDATAVLQLVAQ